MRGENDLARLVTGMTPVLDPIPYGILSAHEGIDWPPTALMRFREAEGDTLILSVGDIPDGAVWDRRVFRRITLSVHSDLDAVGLTAAVATCLAKCGIPANVVAGYYHDHIFVPDAKADSALAALEALSREYCHD